MPHPMALEVAVVGGHGKVALRLLRLLSERGYRARGLIRNPAHASDVEATGATAAGADIENLDADGLARSIAGVDAVVFAAGAGAGSGAARKHTGDYGGAVEVIEGAAVKDVSPHLLGLGVGGNHPEERAGGEGPPHQGKGQAR